MSIADRWTIDLYRAVRRDPEAYPRRVVEYGQALAAFSVGVALEMDLYPGGVLAPIREGIAYSLADPVDHRILARTPHWIQLFSLIIIRDEFAKRFGATAIPVFDGIADYIQSLGSNEFGGEHVLDLDYQPLSTWFRHYDFAFHHFQALEEEGDFPGAPLPDDPEAEQDSIGFARVKAFVETVMFHDSRSPVHLDDRPREDNEHHLQVALHVGWVEVPAIRLAHGYRKEVLKALLAVGADPHLGEG
ncbi:MAG TPA: hypothetical protein VFN22_03330 [Gemmatimonadales bacterium]|nr:hypothetical protein [Gemmatimonadales bacterium]